ncbi:ATP-binding protein [Bradyrhizobium septentrionale]|uniref:magnesium chelatase subunit ChlI family protein n=1 Tax=Bradyrhizobium septentrionale TaxID=1404411 RepID=UPI00140DBD6D|nr:ATP-binding protein [Bradyrhizobium septentrionale]
MEAPAASQQPHRSAGRLTFTQRYLTDRHAHAHASIRRPSSYAYETASAAFLTYFMSLSGPLMDRIDLRIEVPAVTAADLILPPPAEGSAEVARRVAAARDIQLARYAAAGMPQVRTNAEAPSSLLETIAQPDAHGQKLLREAAETMHLTARGYHRVLRVARTLADLDGAETIGRLHLAEALSYRALADDLRRAA